MKSVVKKVKLINPRGRVVEIPESKIKSLFARGFTRAHQDQNHEYNPVFDKQESTITHSKVLSSVNYVERKILKVDKI